MSRRFRRDFFLTLCLSLASIATVWADTNEPAEPPVESTVVTDDPRPPEVSPAEVAREVLRLQEEMGGSIVTDWNTAPTQVDPTQRAIYQPNIELPAAPAVQILRESARQLEQSAHQLESLDLYQQADLLRDMAAKLIKESRRLKSVRASVTAPAQTLPE
jgi:hypothetical protein